MSVTIRFYAELNDFLPYGLKNADIESAYDRRRSVKDLIEACGIPHTEVDLIIVNGAARGFDHVLSDKDRVGVYPRFRSIDISALTNVRAEPLSKMRFVLDIHLGKLASYLRMLGFDTLYRNDYEDPELARVSVEEKRMLLTRDHGLLKRCIVSHGYFVRETDPMLQLAEIIGRFSLLESAAPFARCLVCNGLLRPVEKSSISQRLMPKTEKYYEEFFSCVECGKIYWKGSHYTNMKKFIEAFFARSGASIEKKGIQA